MATTGAIGTGDGGTSARRSRTGACPCPAAGRGGALGTGVMAPGAGGVGEGRRRAFRIRATSRSTFRRGTVARSPLPSSAASEATCACGEPSPCGREERYACAQSQYVRARAASPFRAACSAWSYSSRTLRRRGAKISGICPRPIYRITVPAPSLTERLHFRISAR